ncbi:MAG: flavin reductase family protein [Paracoccaceae bacterium]
MDFDLGTLDSATGYKILTACVHPRPIAWITTQDTRGRINAAPYSFFNAMGSAPPTVAIGLLADPVKGLKDSARNMLEQGEFVVNLVSHALAEAMNVTAVDAPAGTDELALAGLTPAPSVVISPPRIAEAPVALECTLMHSLTTGPQQTIVVGHVRSIHVADQFVKDAARGHIHAEAMDLIGRLHASGYSRCSERFDLERPTWATFRAPVAAPSKG